MGADWLQKTMPDRAERILHQIAECHGRQLNDSRFGKRMKGEGRIAEQIHEIFHVAKNKYLNGKTIPPLDTSHFLKLKDPQMKLFCVRRKTISALKKLKTVSLIRFRM